MSTLTPPDIDQCQAEKPNGQSFMTLGGGPGYVRCADEPTVIATENKAGRDGLKGSMSLCDECKAKLLEQMGTDYATFATIERNDGKARTA